jgi:hypothetical protein
LGELGGIVAVNALERAAVKGGPAGNSITESCFVAAGYPHDGVGLELRKKRRSCGAAHAPTAAEHQHVTHRWKQGKRKSARASRKSTSQPNLSALLPLRALETSGGSSAPMISGI